MIELQRNSLQRDMGLTVKRCMRTPNKAWVGFDASTNASRASRVEASSASLASSADISLSTSMAFALMSLKLCTS